jgi:hypothetical protein
LHPQAPLGSPPTAPKAGGKAAPRPAKRVKQRR